MSYPGNPSLARDVQKRISTTFQQTLGLVAEQRDQEATVGCEFILRMDAQFQPAKTLIARLESPVRPVETGDLKDSPAPQLEDLTNLADLADLEELDDLDDFEGLDDFETLGDDPEPVLTADAAPLGSASATTGLAAVIHDLLAKRSFEQIMQIASTQKRAVDSDLQVRAMVEQARGLLESESYVQTFVKSAAEAEAVGDLEAMEKHLGKAKALDPEHPDVVAFSAHLTGPVAAPAAPDAVLSFDDGDSGLGFDGVPEPSASEGDLRALQQQSLSLKSMDTANTVGELGSDPRQTKPMAAVSLGASESELMVNDFSSAVEEVDADLAFADAMSDPTAEEDPIDLLDADDELEIVGGFEAPEDLSAALAFDDDSVAEASPMDADDGGNRVDGLLAEGQEAFDGGEYQAAIDVWSRIFLIEIDNEEASTKIEAARNKKAELERQAEELFHEASEQLENGSIEEAKKTLHQVLELQPTHSLAVEFLEQLEAGQVPTLKTGGDLDQTLAALEGTEDFVGDFEPGAEGPSLEAAVQRDRIVVVKKTDMRIIALGAAVLLAVIGGVGYLVLEWDNLFPNQEPPPVMAQPPQIDPLVRATKMHEGGNTENAILLLERLQQEEPLYEDAQALIAQWKALVEAPPDLAAAGPSAEQQQRLKLLLGAAREAHRQGRYLRARSYFERAAKILPLEAGDLAFKTEGDDALHDLETQIKLFNDGQYTSIIPGLWRKREADPNNRDIERLLVDSYYNLAVTDLQRGNAQGAAAKMRDALEVQPENEELERLRLFAQTYAQRQQDLLYRIFVKYLPSH